MKYSQQRKQAVIETVGLNEFERAEYCRRGGILPAAGNRATGNDRIQGGSSRFVAIRVNGGMRSSHAIEGRKCCFGH